MLLQSLWIAKVGQNTGHKKFEENMRKTELRNIAHTATAALFSWTSFQFLVKNWHSITCCYIYSDMRCKRKQTFTDLFPVLFHSVFCSEAPWQKKSLTIQKLLVSLVSKRLLSQTAASSWIFWLVLVKQRLGLKAIAMKACCSDLEACLHTDLAPGIWNYSCLWGFPKLSWRHRCKYVSGVCLLNMIMKLAELRLSSGEFILAHISILCCSNLDAFLLA